MITVVHGEITGKGIYSCLFGYLGIGFRYVIYVPIGYKLDCADRLSDCMALFVSRFKRPPPIIGLNGLSFKTGLVQPVVNGLVPCDVILGPSIMLAKTFASVATSNGANERPWELSDELAVSLLAGGVKLPRCARYVASGGDAVVIPADIEQWKAMRDRVRAAGG